MTVLNISTGKSNVSSNCKRDSVREILRQAYAANDIPLSKHATWELDAHDKVKTEWFTRLVGSDNIGGKLLTMSNHHKAMGNKQIKKMTTYPRQIGEKTKGKLTMVLTLG